MPGLCVLKDVLGMVGIECQATAHTKSMATLGAYRLMNSTWANQVVAELNGLELVKKRGNRL